MSHNKGLYKQIVHSPQNNKTMLSEKECSALRGISILAICLHNFCHILPNTIKENEFSFDAHNNTLFFLRLLDYDFFYSLFSYWGHLGVPIFVFLSGFGLSIKYGNDKSISKKNFLLHHYRKLVIPLIIGTGLYLIIRFLIDEEFTLSPVGLFLQCLMLLNLIYGYHDYIVPGPYWYFGMTLQLYFIYILFIYRHSTLIKLFPLFVSILLLFFLEKHQETLIWTKYNSWGWLLPFYMGIYAKEISSITPTNPIKPYIGLFASLCLILLFGAHYKLWIWIPGLTVCAGIFIIKIIPKGIFDYFNSIGKISMYLFVLHPILRDLAFSLNDSYGRLVSTSIYSIGCLLTIQIIISLTKYKSS